MLGLVTLRPAARLWWNVMVDEHSKETCSPVVARKKKERGRDQGKMDLRGDNPVTYFLQLGDSPEVSTTSQ